MAEEVKKTITKASDTAKKAAEPAKKTVTKAAEGTKKTVQAASDGAKKTVRAAADKTKSAAGAAADTAKKTVKRASDAVDTAEEKVTEAAAEVKDTAKEKVSQGQRKIKEAKPTGNATLLRVFAVICWVLALAAEVMAILVIVERIELPMPILWGVIIFLVVDLIFCVVASQLWKKANHIDPASEKNPLKFWLWNNIGVIMAAVCFLPFIIFTLTNKRADAKTKLIATLAAVGCMAIAGLTGYDWNPVSQEQKASAEHVLEGVDVYWSNYGHRYHLDENCSSLSRSATLTYGDVDQAIAANKTHLCKFCFNNHAEEYEGLEKLIAGASE